MYKLWLLVGQLGLDTRAGEIVNPVVSALSTETQVQSRQLQRALPVGLSTRYVPSPNSSRQPMGMKRLFTNVKRQIETNKERLE